jgi:hypothetical protein
MAESSDNKYRIFVCYAHDDENICQVVMEHLKSLGMEPTSSASLMPGKAYRDEIRVHISRAHLFMPIVTEIANSRPWVHQEIGIALGMRIPVLPLAVGTLPKGMAEELQAVSFKNSHSGFKQKLNTQLTRDTIEQRIWVDSRESKPVFQSAELHEDRTTMLKDAAEQLLRLRKHGKIRQVGALTSFSLPAEDQSDEFWKKLDGDGPQRARALRRDLIEERLFLEQHAEKAGCDLILCPSIPLKLRGDPAKQLRLTILRDFLDKMSRSPIANSIRAVIAKESEVHAGNLLFIGDWFMAESVTPIPGFGYRQTLGTWHAPTILHRIEQFDREFGKLWNLEPDLKKTIQKLDATIASLNKSPQRSGRRSRR